MVANTIHRPGPQYPQRDLERDLERVELHEPEVDSYDSLDRQKVSVAPDSDKVHYSAVLISFSVSWSWLTWRPYRYLTMWKWKRGRMLRVFDLS
jgi:hypothetical protein